MHQMRETPGETMYCDLQLAAESKLESPWPVMGGLPLPQGAVDDSRRIEVVDEHGTAVPVQIDTTAAYSDGSIRWALLSLNAIPGNQYRAVIGPAKPSSKSSPASTCGTSSTSGTSNPCQAGLTVSTQDETMRIDTGAAVFTLSPDNLLPTSAVLCSGQRLWQEGEATAWLVDNLGRLAHCAGHTAEVTREVLKNGPLRLVVRTEGWYITADDERLARGVAHISFFAHQPMVQILHTLEFTRDTEELWLRGYGLDIPFANGSSAVFDCSPSFDAQVHTVPLQPGERACLLQDTYPHFAETESHFSLTHTAAGEHKELLSGRACGEWADLSNEAAGITVVLPDLAEQFPKELEASDSGIRVHFWPERCGRAWDFRTPTLIEEYWGRWIKQGVWYAGETADRLAELSQLPSNAAGAAKSHEVWVIPHCGPVDIPTAVQQGHTVCKPPLLQAEPTFLCATGAVGWPIHPKDEERFPREEAVIADHFDRLLLPLEVFPLTGLIQWGSCPHIRYRNYWGRFVSQIFRTRGGTDYGLRRHTWSLYARSGERKYWEYGHRFNRRTADWDIAHHSYDDVIRGGFPYDSGRVHEPMPWRGPKALLDINNSGHDIANWLLEHYLTGDEYVHSTVMMYGEAMKQAWDLHQAKEAQAQMLLLRVLTLLYTHTWDPAFREMAASLAEEMIDLTAPTGLSDHLNGQYGPLYKENRSALALYDYWSACGDTAAQQALLKLLDYLYRFDRAYHPPNSYQNASAFLYAVAWEWTGRTGYLDLVRQLVSDAVDDEPLGLKEELASVSDIHRLERLPYRGVHLNMHYLLGMPTALGVLAEQPEGGAFPLIDGRGEETQQPVVTVVEKPEGKAISLLLFVPQYTQGRIGVRIFAPSGQPADVHLDLEERLPYRDWELEEGRQNPRSCGGAVPSPYPPFSILCSIPAEAPAGLYRVHPEPPDGWYLVLETDAPTLYTDGS